MPINHNVDKDGNRIAICNSDGTAYVESDFGITLAMKRSRIEDEMHESRREAENHESNADKCQELLDLIDAYSEKRSIEDAEAVKKAREYWKRWGNLLS